jgi:hypothetical protein
MSKHLNNGACPSCAGIFNRYYGFYPSLRAWFSTLQMKYPEAHISCAGRGREDQERCVEEGASLAHWTHSAHNYNAAIDIFFQVDGKLSYSRKLYEDRIAPALTQEFEWYGAPGAVFQELPHVQVRNYQNMNLNLVEL